MNDTTKLTMRHAAIAGLALTATSAHAAVVFTTATNGPVSPSSTTDELAYAGDVSTTDLLNGIVGVSSGSWGANGATPAGLNDGTHGGDYEADGLPALVGASWALANGATMEYDLGVGSGDGYDITEIQSIAAWQNLGLSNQNYNVLVKYVGDAGFTALTTVTYQPFTSGGGSTKVNVTDDTGVLASGIEAIKFDFLATDGNGSSVYREIDVLGSAAVPEPTTTALLALGGLALILRRRK